MSIEEIIQQRQIAKILHFTTHQGLTGILNQRLVKCRNLLKEDETLEFILKLNTSNIYDPDWKGYVNLSIERINMPLFGYSENRHRDQEWRILAFEPEILTHSGVHFVTTNNAYSQHLKRGTGIPDLENLFADTVVGRYGVMLRRGGTMPQNWTTDVQAEVLYPQQLSTDYLRTVFVRSSVEADLVAGVVAAVDHPPVKIVVDEGLFR